MAQRFRDNGDTRALCDPLYPGGLLYGPGISQEGQTIRGTGQIRFGSFGTIRLAPHTQQAAVTWMTKIIHRLRRGKNVEEEKAISYEHEKVIATIKRMENLVNDDIKNITERITGASRGDS